MTAFMKKNKILMITIILYLLVLVLKPELFMAAVRMTGGFLLEMLEIMPAVLVISALITVWIPASVISRNFGDASGFRGKIISILIGAFSAGPIYAAFPMAKTLLNKGASVGNIVIIVSSWAVIKVPMLLVEIKFLGLAFALTRYLLTIPAILLLGIFMERHVRRSDMKVEPTTARPMTQEEIYRQLPRMNCGACGHGDCRGLAAAIAEGDATLDDCPVRGK